MFDNDEWDDYGWEKFKVYNDRLDLIREQNWREVFPKLAGCVMSDIRIAYYNKTDERVINDLYNYYAKLENWCSDPAIIEEKIFNGDLHSGINYSVSTNIGVPHMAHFFAKFRC